MHTLTKRFLSVLLALVMIVGLGSTALAAANTDTVTVHVKIQNPEDSTSPLFDQDVTLNINDKLDTLSDSTIENGTTATVMDAILKTGMAVNYYKVQYTQYNAATGKWEPINQYGIAFDKIDQYEQTGSYDEESDTTTYSYWEVQLGNDVLWNYASNYALTDGMQINVNWSSYTY